MAGAAAGGTLNGKREMPLGTSRFFYAGNSAGLQEGHFFSAGCRRDIFVPIRAARPAYIMLQNCSLCRSVAAKMPLLHLFVGRSGLSVGRARIVGGTFLSRFGLQGPPSPRCRISARRWRASRQKCRSYIYSLGVLG